MKIYTIKEGQSFGPYTKGEILNQIMEGDLSNHDLGWSDGLARPVPLSEILFHPTTAMETTDILFQQHFDIAIRQKAIIGIAVAWLVCGFTPTGSMLDILLCLAFYAVHVLGVVLSCQLARALGKNPWIWGLLTLVPFVNLFAYASLASQAGRRLTSRGVKNGIFGVSWREIHRLKMD